MLKPVLRAIGTCSFLRLGLRRRIVQAFYKPGRLQSYAFEVPYHGMKYKGDIATAQEWHVYFFGGYELKESALMADLLGQMNEPVALDVGANLGGHTYTMALHADHVHSFEPFAPLADKIQEQLDRNTIENVTLHRHGLGDKEDVKPYYLDLESSNSGTGSFISDHTGAPEVGRLQIRKGDECAACENIDFMKIDVEGYEASVLKGLRKNLKSQKPIIMMEVTESSLDFMKAYGGLEKLLPFEYDLYEIRNPATALGIFQTSRYELKKISDIVGRSASYNILIEPKSEIPVLETLI